MPQNVNWKQSIFVFFLFFHFWPFACFANVTSWGWGYTLCMHGVCRSLKWKRPRTLTNAERHRFFTVSVSVEATLDFIMTRGPGSNHSEMEG